MKTEYLVSVNKKENIATTAHAFNNLLSSVDDIKINNGNLEFKDNSFKYSLQTNVISDTDYICYHLIVEFDCKDINLDSREIKNYQELLRTIRIILSKNNMALEILWDDISFHCSKIAYPLIYEIENLTRKLLTKFMLINIGTKWEKENIPLAINQSRNNNKNTNANNGLLYRLDFIELSVFLFNEYSLKSNISELTNLVDENNNVPYESVKQFIPKSNWDRYFKSIVSVDGAHLKKQWDRLYELRCKIAHNNFFTVSDYNDVTQIVNDLKPSIEKAINTLDDISIESTDKETITESYAMASNEQLGKLIVLYNEMLTILQNKSNMESSRPIPYQRLVGELLDKEYINDEQYKKLKVIFYKRNQVIHEHNSISAAGINELISEIELLIQSISQKTVTEANNET